mmetsp:Transcript_5011/g.14898  ORF Transcript_5011/g.14898 Transcript_5011/m.14898 type:complete len:396 (+) Transcript_5011:857-2044(+)
MRRKLRSKSHCRRWFMPDLFNFSKLTCSASNAAAKASLSATFIAKTKACGISATLLLTSMARRAPSARRSKTKEEAWTGTGTALTASAFPADASLAPLCGNLALPQPQTCGTSSSARRQNDSSVEQLSRGVTAKRAHTQYAALLYCRMLSLIAWAFDTRPGSPDNTAELRRPWRLDCAESSVGFSSITAESKASNAVAARAALRCMEPSEGGFADAAAASCCLPSPTSPPRGHAGVAGGRRTLSHVLARLSLTAPSSAAMIATGITPPCFTLARSAITSPSCSLNRATRNWLCLCISRISSRLCISLAPAPPAPPASPAPLESTASSRLSSAADTSSRRRSAARSRTTSAQAVSTVAVRTVKASAGTGRPGRKRWLALRQRCAQSPCCPRESTER